MKRLHVHVNVTNLDEAIGYYAALFGSNPTVTKPDYAKWMLDDPHVNFAISAGGKAGLSHLGIQVESAGDLRNVSEQLGAAETMLLEENDAQCCYARSDKYWGRDPAGIAWELFHTHGEAGTLGSSALNPVTEHKAAPVTAGGCC
jgi:catechol-2,3-dioxygenase